MGIHNGGAGEFRIRGEVAFDKGRSNSTARSGWLFSTNPRANFLLTLVSDT